MQSLRNPLKKVILLNPELLIKTILQQGQCQGTPELKDLQESEDLRNCIFTKC
tara:strand:+ start:10605 stop:10763 length:159 start_codon:yes stop_codon:yes gene_type:complete